MCLMNAANCEQFLKLMIGSHALGVEVAGNLLCWSPFMVGNFLDVAEE